MKTLIKKLKNQKGFTMVESILAATVLAVALLGGMTVLQNATANTVNNDLSTVATQLANEQIEKIMADKSFKGYDYLVSDNYSSGISQDTNLYNMTRTITITEVSASDLVTPEDGSGVKKITVAIVWGSASYQKVAVDTLISNYQ